MARATADSPRMFKSDWLDAGSRTHWSVVPLLYLPAATGAFAYARAGAEVGWAAGLSLAAVGFVAWTLAEYWLHRTLFHWQPPGALGSRVHFLLHGVHHQWPKDRYRLVMPPAVSIIYYLVSLGLFYWLLGPRLVWAFHAGFVLGYVFYDLSHYYLHHGRPKGSYLRRLQRHHLLHHYQDDSLRFGVSNMIWDRVFCTDRSRAPEPGAHPSNRWAKSRS